MGKDGKSGTYREKLLDPRWQKKRLEILDRDEWMCMKCGDMENTLHVHHQMYFFGVDPWDYPEGLLITLCESCHQKETEEARLSVPFLTETLHAKGYWASDFREIAAGFQYMHMAMSKFPRSVVAKMIHWALQDETMAHLISDGYCQEMRRRSMQKIDAEGDVE
jgi:cytochrome c553